MPQVPAMAKIRKEFLTNPDFDPSKVANASSAAEGLCKWVLAMEIYDRVAKVVAPKKERLKQAEEELSETMRQLNEKRAMLKEVVDRLALLNKQFEEATDKKQKLEYQVRWVPIHFAVLSCFNMKGKHANETWLAFINVFGTWRNKAVCQKYKSIYKSIFSQARWKHLI